MLVSLSREEMKEIMTAAANAMSGVFIKLKSLALDLNNPIQMIEKASSAPEYNISI